MFSRIVLPAVSGTNMIINTKAKNTISARNRKVKVFPPSVSMVVRKTEATTKLLNQLVAFARATKVVASWIGNISYVTVQMVAENPIAYDARYTMMLARIKMLPTLSSLWIDTEIITRVRHVIGRVLSMVLLLP